MSIKPLQVIFLHIIKGEPQPKFYNKELQH